MPKTKIYRGWIHGERQDEEILRELGVKVGPWQEELKAWTDCDVTAKALDSLDRHWGRFVWGLEIVEVDS